ncbi:hypothetical protein ACFQRL_07910 [Microbacterium fluvii]|uniref:TRAM domain-containing protein n=1 Tax=Microbacterium fluvii TaxID=415215 RepID=A0ABW2HC41_9MICO|nr:hypothetical protein [Microbacterium fluvii]MCU4672510.1 hypothetical protein [Microbacterium fluvii]
MRLRTWTRRRGLVLLAATALAVDLTAGGVFAGLAVSAAAADDDTASSAVTMLWNDGTRDADAPDYAAFEQLSVTVSQTEDLTNQGITVSWTGGVPTSEGDFTSDFLQIMQCWSDAGVAPEPQQCQFGAPSSSLGALTGPNVGGRAFVEGEDPEQPYDDDVKVPPTRTNPWLRSFAMPFTSVKGTSGFDISPYWSAATTNELTAVRTGDDGTGTAVFETQTSLEAPHLGCGATEAATGEPRSCWLVIVPRGSTNLDGTPATTSSNGRLSGSALSASAWKNRIAVELGFRAVSTSCPIGAQEVRTVGSEPVAEAMTSWQAALCSDGSVYGYSQIGDDEARTQLVSDMDGAASLAFVGRALDAEQSEGETLRYAPVVNGSIGIAFNIDYALGRTSQIYGRNGTPVTDLVLNPRLVAKLLTQSYRADVPGGNAAAQVAGNPRTIRNDPEFLALNPEFADFLSSAGPDGLIVALGSSDANELVWNWVRSDPDAAAFLQGQPDAWGMTVNDAYLALGLAGAGSDSFPKADLTTTAGDQATGVPGYGTLDLRPYVNDMHEAAYRARRADAGMKIVWDAAKTPAGFVAAAPQLPGSRFELAITDTASAQRYGLTMARLVNAAGVALAPTAAAVAAGVEVMQPGDVAEVRVTDPDVRSKSAYPLSYTEYAVVDVCGASLSSLTSYAGLLDYVGGAGQVAGDGVGALPRGYVPLNEEQRATLAAAAAALRSEVKTPTCDEHQPQPTPTPTPDASADPPASVDTPADPAPVTENTPAPQPSPTAGAQASAPAEFAANQTGGAARYAFLASALLAAPCLLGGPLLLRRGR